MSKVISAMVVISLFAVACSGGNNGTGNNGTATTNATATTAPAGTITASATATAIPPTNPPAEVIGRVVSAGTAMVSGSLAHDRDDLHPGDVVQAGATSTGDIQFEVLGPNITCNAVQGADLQLRPSTGIEIEWLTRDGLTGCSIDAPEDRTFTLEGDQNPPITIRKGEFGLDQGTLYVRAGVALMMLATGQTITVCPHYSITLTPEGIAQPPQYWVELPPALDIVVKPLPRPDFTRLPTTAEINASAYLQEITTGKEPLPVNVSGGSDATTTTFLKGFFGQMLQDWHQVTQRTQVTINAIDAATRQEMLKSNPNAIIIERGATITNGSEIKTLKPKFEAPFVLVTVLPATKVPPTATPTATPTPDLAASLRASGLFSDEAGGTWRLVTGTDDVANKVLTRYVAGAVLSGEFAQVYHDAFGEPPPCSLMMQLAEDAE